RIVQPLLLGQMLLYFNTTGIDKFYAYKCVIGIILCSAVNMFVVHLYMMDMTHFGMKGRVACCSLIYRKTLKLTRTALGETTIDQAVNLLSNDVNRFDVSIIFLHYLWLGPLEPSCVRGIVKSFIVFMTRISLFIMIMSYILFRYKITTEKVYAITAYYNNLSLIMTAYFPQGMR
ncbi:Multidrug resistance-associated protein 4, partial [Trachymyrmex cornetzi]